MHEVSTVSTLYIKNHLVSIFWVNLFIGWQNCWRTCMMTVSLLFNICIFLILHYIYIFLWRCLCHLYYFFIWFFNFLFLSYKWRISLQVYRCNTVINDVSFKNRIVILLTVNNWTQKRWFFCCFCFLSSRVLLFSWLFSTVVLHILCFCVFIIGIINVPIHSLYSKHITFNLSSHTVLCAHEFNVNKTYGHPLRQFIFAVQYSFGHHNMAAGHNPSTMSLFFYSQNRDPSFSFALSWAESI